MALDTGAIDIAYQRALAFHTSKDPRLRQNEAPECFRVAAEVENPLPFRALTPSHFQVAVDEGHADLRSRLKIGIDLANATARSHF
jgi:hypothetical protein